MTDDANQANQANQAARAPRAHPALTAVPVPVPVPGEWAVVSPGVVHEHVPVESISLYASRAQQEGRTLRAVELLAELDWARVLPADVLDALLAEPESVPKKWKGKTISFWGTRYRDETGELAIRYLFWNGVAWDWYFIRLDDMLDAHGAAALRSEPEARSPGHSPGSVGSP